MVWIYWNFKPKIKQKCHLKIKYNSKVWFNLTEDNLRPEFTPGFSGLSSYGSWIYNYLCNQCLSPLMFWVRISIRGGCTTLCDKVCRWLATGQWFSPGPPVSSTNKTDRHDITEITESGIKHHQTKQTNTPGFWWGCVTQSLVLCVCFVDRCFFIWPLCCLFFFTLQILITPLVSSNSSYHENDWIQYLW
jgi:hypothetical protein